MADEQKVQDKPFAVAAFDTIAGGALPERFEAAIVEVLANIRDPNTDAEVVREIVIKIRIKPDATRAKWAASTKVTTKLAGLTALPDTLYLGRDEDGRIRPFTFDPKQADMFNEKEQAGIYPLNPNATGAR